MFCENYALIEKCSNMSSNLGRNYTVAETTTDEFDLHVLFSIFMLI